MPDIVVREISRHRLDAVSRSLQQITAGLSDLRRNVGSAILANDLQWVSSAKDTAVHAFEDQLQTFLKSHNGIILEPEDVQLTSQLFDMYFLGHPPFGGGKDKKHEFPDAASLLMLEHFAKTKNLQVIAVSKDSGWSAYANMSRNVYCVPSIDDLTALFISQSQVAKEVKNRVATVLQTPDSSLSRTLKKSIESGLLSLPWKVDLPHSYRYEFDSLVTQVKLNHFEVQSDAIGVWITSSKEDVCVAELPFDVDVSLRVEIAASERDSFIGESDVVQMQTFVEQRFEIKLQVELEGALQSTPILDMVKNISLNNNPIDVRISREHMGPSWSQKWLMSSGFDDMEDDIPF